MTSVLIIWKLKEVEDRMEEFLVSNLFDGGKKKANLILPLRSLMNSTSSNSRLLSCLKMIMHWIKRLFYFIRAYKELYYFIEVKFFLILVRFILCSLKTTLNHDLIDASITTLNFPEVTIFLVFFFLKESVAQEMLTPTFWKVGFTSNISDIHSWIL